MTIKLFFATSAPLIHFFLIGLKTNFLKICHSVCYIKNLNIDLVKDKFKNKLCQKKTLGGGGGQICPPGLLGLIKTCIGSAGQEV